MQDMHHLPQITFLCMKTFRTYQLQNEHDTSLDFLNAEYTVAYVDEYEIIK